MHVHSFANKAQRIRVLCQNAIIIISISITRMHRGTHDASTDTEEKKLLNNLFLFSLFNIKIGKFVNLSFYIIDKFAYFDIVQCFVTICIVKGAI